MQLYESGHVFYDITKDDSMALDEGFPTVDDDKSAPITPSSLSRQQVKDDPTATDGNKLRKDEPKDCMRGIVIRVMTIVTKDDGMAFDNGFQTATGTTSIPMTLSLLSW